jgi:hypothetical protein
MQDQIEQVLTTQKGADERLRQLHSKVCCAGVRRICSESACCMIAWATKSPLAALSIGGSNGLRCDARSARSSLGWSRQMPSLRRQPPHSAQQSATSANCTARWDKSADLSIIHQRQKHENKRKRQELTLATLIACAGGPDRAARLRARHSVCRHSTAAQQGVHRCVHTITASPFCSLASANSVQADVNPAARGSALQVDRLEPRVEDFDTIVDAQRQSDKALRQLNSKVCKLGSGCPLCAANKSAPVTTC